MTGEVFFGSSPGVLLLAQVTLCIGGGLAASTLFRSRIAKAHQVLLVGLLMSVVMPCLTLLVSHLDIGLFASETVTRPDMAFITWEPAEAPGHVLPGPEMESSPVVQTAAEAPPVMEAVQGPAPARLPWESGLLACWIVATVVLLSRLVLRFILGLHLVHLSHAVHHEGLCGAAAAARARLGITRSVRVRSSRRVSTPIIWGWSREPVVLVPKDAEQQSVYKDWVGLFCHELAHWKRLDHLCSLLAELVACVFPWHPLIWWARTRLIRLSEQVCDDWVLACGEAGVDYAELLLELSPQRPVTLLPAIVGKGHTMKERIRRIVQEECGNPRVGRSWTLGLATLATMAVVGVAFAQTRPAIPEERSFQEQRQEVAMAGRRNVLKRMLEPLHNQLRETEKVLAERPEGMGEEGQILRSEREALREQIERLEMQLRNLDRGPRIPEPIDAPMARQAAEQAERLQDLRRLAEKIQDRLQGVDDKEGDQARALREELDGVREKIAMTERQMQELRRQRGVNEQEPLQADRARRGETNLQPRVIQRQMPENEMQVRVYKLRYAHPEQMVGILRPLVADGKVVADERTGSLVVSVRPENNARIDNVIRELDMPGTGPERDRPQADPGLQNEVADLRGQVKGLNEKMQQLQRLLEQLLQQRTQDNQTQETLDRLLKQNPGLK